MKYKLLLTPSEKVDFLKTEDFKYPIETSTTDDALDVDQLLAEYN